jgi:hypothetical protein
MNGNQQIKGHETAKMQLETMFILCIIIIQCPQCFCVGACVHICVCLRSHMCVCVRQRETLREGGSMGVHIITV